MSYNQYPLCQKDKRSDDVESQGVDLDLKLKVLGLSSDEVLNFLQEAESSVKDEYSSKNSKRAYDIFHYFNCSTKKNVFFILDCDLSKDGLGQRICETLLNNRECLGRKQFVVFLNELCSNKEEFLYSSMEWDIVKTEDDYTSDDISFIRVAHSIEINDCISCYPSDGVVCDIDDCRACFLTTDALVSHQVGVHVGEDGGSNAVHCAAQTGKLDVLKVMVEKYGTQILLEKGNDGRNALDFAVQADHFDCIDYIVGNCPGNQVMVDDNWYNAYHLTARAALKAEPPSISSNLDAKFLAKLTQFFNEKGQDGLTVDKEGMHPLHYAAQHGLIRSVQYLFEKGDAQQLINLKDENQNNLIHMAAKAGHFDLLQWLSDQCDTESLLEKGHKGFTALHFAAREGHVNCVERLLDAAPDSFNVRDSGEDLAIHWAAWAGKLNVLKVMVEIYGKEVLSLTGYGGANVLYFAAQNGHLECIEYMFTMCKGLQNVANKLGENSFHIAAGAGQTKVLRYLIEQSDSKGLMTENKDGGTPLHVAVWRNRYNCVKELLSNQTIQASMSRIDLFGDLISRNKKIGKLLTDTRKKYGTEHISWPALDSKPSMLHCKQKSASSVDSDKTVSTYSRIGQSAEWPLMPKKKGRLSSLALQGKAVLSRLECVGIYLLNTAYPDETEKQFWSMGDLNAGVQMACILEKMGAQSLDVVLLPQDESTCSERSVYQGAEKSKYNRQKKIVKHKLASILPEFNPDEELPQTLKIGTCQMTFRYYDDKPSALPHAMFTFNNIKPLCQGINVLAQKVVTLRPYHYWSGFQMVTTDIQGNRGNVFPLRLPDNSVIPEVKDDSHGMERSSIVTPRAVGSSPLEKVINQLNEKSRSGQLDLGVVYGLHHDKLFGSWPTVLDKWFSTIRAYTEQATDQKPAIIAVPSNVVLETGLKQFAEEKKLPLIDLSAISCVAADDQEAVAEKIIKQISQLQPGKPALCIVPSLSKPQFDELVLSSRLPTLAEGANLTSFLLQYGHPYLSVLPSGYTPVAQDMGDPFEALKARAFSYKLAINEAERKVLESLASFVKDKKEESYKQAIKKINNFDSQTLPNLRFLWERPKPSIFLKPEHEPEQLTLMKLLKKGEEGKLGDIGQHALLSVLDPSLQAFEQYIRNAMNKESATARHFELQKLHVNGPSLNAVNSALIQLEKRGSAM